MGISECNLLLITDEPETKLDEILKDAIGGADKEIFQETRLYAENVLHEGAWTEADIKILSGTFAEGYEKCLEKHK